MTNIAFRKKTFKGAKIEDTIQSIDLQLELLENKKDTEYYRGMKDGLERAKVQLIQSFKYEYTEEEN